MLQELLVANEGKTVEFKENASSLPPIIKTVVAFANTAGGIPILGIEDQSKKVIGIKHVLQEEERIASAIADSIDPLLRPDIEILSYQEKELLAIHVPYLAGLYFVKSKGIKSGAYVRLGSTNRLADNETLSNLLRVAKHISFDKTPCLEASVDDLDHELMTNKLQSIYKTLNKKYCESLGITAYSHNNVFPTYGGILLFSSNKNKFLPDSSIRCVCFLGDTRKDILDQKDIDSNLIDAVDEAIYFIERQTNVAAKIGRMAREDIPQFPPIAVREAIINAIVHTDYSLSGSSVQVAVFTNRIEITNPGGLPFGQSIESALSGVSRIRNRLIVEIFRELRLIERLGSGIPRIFESYKDEIAIKPKFEELGNNFRVTLCGIVDTRTLKKWEQELIAHLKGKKLSTKEIAVFWKVNVRTARMRLAKLLEKEFIQRIAKSKTDPMAVYQLRGK